MEKKDFDRSRFKRHLFRRLQAKLRTRTNYEKYLDRKFNIDIKKFDDDEFGNESQFVKRVKSEVLQWVKKLDDNYKQQLLWVNKTEFPKDWMINDEQIKDVLDRYPKLIPLLNYIYNLNASFRGVKFNKMIADTAEITDQKHGEKDWPYSTFKTNKKFYKKLCRELGTSKKYIERHIMALVNMGIFLKLADRRQKGWIMYADGYWMEYWNAEEKRCSIRKISLLNKDKHKMLLRDFPEFLGT